MGHATHMDGSCHTYESVRSHIWMSHVTHMDGSYHKYECVMSHIWIRHVTHMNASCHTYECVMSHVWMRHNTHMNKSCHTYERGATCVETREAFCSAVFVTSNCAMSLSLCCSSPCDCATWLVDMCNFDSSICATWLICMCYTTRSYVRYDSFVTSMRLSLCLSLPLWLTHTWHHSFHMCGRQNPFICATRHIHIWQESFMFTTTHPHVTRLKWMVVSSPWFRERRNSALNRKIELQAMNTHAASPLLHCTLLFKSNPTPPFSAIMSRTNEQWHKWMSHGWVMSRMIDTWMLYAHVEWFINV